MNPRLLGKTAHPVRSLRRYLSLSIRSRRTFNAAREVVQHSETTGVPVRRTIVVLRSRGYRTTERSVKKYFGEALGYDKRGRLVVVRRDRNVAIMRAITTLGWRQLVPAGAINRSIVAKHKAAVNAYRLGDGGAKLHAWAEAYGHKTFRGVDGLDHALETDLDAIDYWLEREPEGPELYEDPS
jgi:hypothetical protein